MPATNVRWESRTLSRTASQTNGKQHAQSLPLPWPSRNWHRKKRKRLNKVKKRKKEKRKKTSSQIPWPNKISGRNFMTLNFITWLLPWAMSPPFVLWHLSLSLFSANSISWSQNSTSTGDLTGVNWRTYINRKLWVNNPECRPQILILNSASDNQYLALAG